MKFKLFSVIFFMTIIISCQESYKIIDPNVFNGIVAKRTDLNSISDLMSFYYSRNLGIEETPKFTLEIDTLNENNFLCTLIADKLGDDSKASEKVIMTAKKNGNQWIVLEIKKNWKCYENRGHTNWGIKNCF